MKNSVKRFSVVLGFCALLTLLALNAGVTRRQVALQVDADQWVGHTQQVLLELTRIESLLTQAESGQRGFLYTNDERYLEPYKRASTEVESHIARVAELTVDNPEQQARIPQLRSLSEQKLNELAETIRLHQAGDPDRAKALVQTDVGLFTMGKIDALLDTMQQQEVQLERRRTAAYGTSVQHTISSIYLTTLAAALGLCFLAFYILREIRLRERHAEQIRQREEWFG